jgi:tetratricopeptide (TPR) repeat protein
MPQLFRFLLPLLFCLAPLVSGAQNTRDSLLQCWKNPDQKDTARLKALHKYIINYYIYNDPDSAFILCKQEFDFALKNKQPTYCAKALFIEGIYHKNKGDFTKARESFIKSKSISTSSGDSVGIADTENNLGLLFIANGQLDKAVSSFYRALSIYESKKEIAGLQMIYANLGICYLSARDTATALLFYYKALDELKKLPNENKEAILFLNIATLEKEDPNKIELVKSRIDKCIEFCKRTGNKRLLPRAYLLLAEVFINENNYKKSDEYITLCKSSLEQTQDSSQFASFYGLKGQHFYHQKKYNAAIPYFEQSMGMNRRLGIWDEVRKSATVLVDLYELTGNTKAALETYKLVIQAKDSVNITNAEKMLLREQINYEFEKIRLTQKAETEKKIISLQADTEAEKAQKNILLIIISSAVIILTVSGYFFIRNQKQKSIIAEQKTNILQQKLLVSQINPHFIFNSLNAVQNYIFKENSLVAGDYLSRFANLMRMILNFSREEFINISSEVDFITNYLDLQKLRFGNSFNYSICIDEEIDTISTQIPPMLGQPFIENAVEHGIKHMKSGGQIDIKIYFRNNILTYEIEDNGCGINTNTVVPEIVSKHKSLAIIITRERLDSFSSSSEKHSISIINKQQPEFSSTGVKVIFTVPFIEK